MSTLMPPRGYSVEAITNCAALLISPAQHISRIWERIEYTQGELTYATSITCVLPETGLPAATGKYDDRIYLVPILIPRKGRLATVTNYEAADGVSIRPLSHAEHAAIARQMISTLAWQAYLFYANSSARRAIIESAINDLMDVVRLGPREAGRLVSEIFTPKGRLRSVSTSLKVTKRETRLWRLCNVLSDSNIIVVEARLDHPAGHSVTVRFRHRCPLAERDNSVRGILARFVASEPCRLEAQVPFARRTDDYNLFFEAPQSRYVAEMWAYYRDKSAKGWRQRRALPRLGHNRGSPTKPRAQVELGAVRDRHLLISDGSRAKCPLSVGIATYEVPLGSIASAWIANIFATVTFVLLLLARWRGNDAVRASDVPALLALVPAAVAIVGSLFQTAQPSSSSILSKISIVGSSLLAVVYAAWWVFSEAGPLRPETGKFGRFAFEHGGSAVVLGSSAILSLVTLRAINVVWDFRRVEKGLRPFSLRRSTIKLGRRIRRRAGRSL